MRALLLLTALQALTANAAPHRRRQVCAQSASSTTTFIVGASSGVVPGGTQSVAVSLSSSQVKVTKTEVTSVTSVAVHTSTLPSAQATATSASVAAKTSTLSESVVPVIVASTVTTAPSSEDTPVSPEVESGGSVIEITETSLTGSTTYGTASDFTPRVGTASPLSTSTVIPSVSVVTSEQSSGTVQILPSATVEPNTSGIIISQVTTTASAPLISASIATPSTKLVGVSSVTSLGGALASTMAVSSNIFVPVATDAPPSVIGSRSDHPVPRLGIQAQNSPLSTNKFYANFFLSTQTAPSWTHPYSVAWAKGGGSSASWGMSIAHIDANQRVYGDNSTTTGAASYFINPNGIQSIVLSAAELGSSTALTTDTLTSFSVNVNLLASSGTTPVITFPLVQGMGFVTAIYNGGTPLIQTGVFFRSITKAASPKSGVTKYNILLEDGKTWYVYAYSTDGAELDFTVVNNGLAQATSNFNGFIQVAKDPGNAVALYDAQCGVYPVSAALSGSVSGTTGSYTLAFSKAGLTSQTLLMFALPHHLQSFSSTTSSSLTSLQLQTTTKGIATAVLADSWTLVESLPTTMDFAPWSPSLGSRTTLTSAAKAAISSVAASEVSQNMTAQSNLDSMYYSGKALAKFAGIVYTINDLLDNASLAAAGLTQLKAAFNIFASNTQQYPLVHETAWGGVVSTASYVTGDSGVDFGNTYYNDHHFHYGYFIYAAAVIGYLDPTWLAANKAWVNTLVRDIANPSTQDNYFPVYRNFDWYHGHGWAHGLYETFDGKDEESSSEDSMHAYALKLWGRTIGDANLEARGNLQLAITARSLQNYFLYTSDNTVEPAQFIGNKVSGILFENKIDHTTYFGANIEYIQGIHMIPLLPSSTLTRTQTFVSQEWNTYFSNGRVDSIVGGWKGLLYANLAIIDPITSFNFFASSSFDASFLDGGASRTWYLAFAAGQTDTYSTKRDLAGNMEPRDHGAHGIPAAAAANFAANPAAPPINYGSKPGLHGRDHPAPQGYAPQMQQYPAQQYASHHEENQHPERKRDKLRRQLGEWIG